MINDETAILRRIDAASDAEVGSSANWLAFTFKCVAQELTNALARYERFASPHEGISVLREEFEELWDEVKIKQGARSRDRLHKEAIQVAAMAIRFAYDCTSREWDAQR